MNTSRITEPISNTASSPDFHASNVDRIGGFLIGFNNEHMLLLIVRVIKEIIMEQDESASVSIKNSSKQENEKQWKIVAIIAFVVAICGAGFGVYGLTQGVQKTPIVDVKIIRMESFW